MDIVKFRGQVKKYTLRKCYVLGVLFAVSFNSTIALSNECDEILSVGAKHGDVFFQNDGSFEKLGRNEGLGSLNIDHVYYVSGKGAANGGVLVVKSGKKQGGSLANKVYLHRPASKAKIVKGCNGNELNSDYEFVAKDKRRKAFPKNTIAYSLYAKFATNYDKTQLKGLDKFHFKYRKANDEPDGSCTASTSHAENKRQFSFNIAKTGTPIGSWELFKEAARDVTNWDLSGRALSSWGTFDKTVLLLPFDRKSSSKYVCVKLKLREAARNFDFLRINDLEERSEDIPGAFLPDREWVSGR